MQRNLDAVGEFGHVALHVERDDLGSALLEIAVAGSTPRCGLKPFVGIRRGELDLLDAHFQGVARLGALDKDRPGEDVAAGTALSRRLVGVDGLPFRLDVRILHAHPRQRCGLPVLMVRISTRSPDLMVSTGLAPAQ